MSKKLESVIFTISDEGTEVKNRLVRETMIGLNELKRRKGSSLEVRGIHMGGDADLIRMIGSYFPELTIIPAPTGNFLQRTEEGMQKLFSNLKQRVAETAKETPASLVYMEGDKPDFVREIEALINPLLERQAEIVIPTRSPAGFSEFPIAQRFWEGMMNRHIAKVTGRNIDLMYGPRAWNSECARYFGNCPMNNFGALTYAVVRAMLEKREVQTLEVQGSPQKDYMAKYPSLFGVPGLHFAYRALQNLPHQKAAEMARREVLG